MKTLFVISMVVLFGLATIPAQAQMKEEPIKKSIKETQKVIKTEKKELKSEKKVLRKLEASTVNAQSKASFYTSFGDVPNVKWKSSVYFDEASFTKDGKTMTAYFDFYGALVGTTSLKTFADVPAKGQKEIKTKYKDYSIGPVVFFDDNEINEMNMMLYGLQFNDEDNYFVELSKGNSKVMVKVNTAGMVSFFKQL